MRVEYAVFARYAESRPDGTWDGLGVGLIAQAADSLPAVIPSLAVVMRLVLDPAEPAVVHMRFRLMSPTGAVVIPANSDYAPVTPPTDPNTGVRSFQMVLQMMQVPVAEFGQYEFRLDSRDGFVYSMPLLICQGVKGKGP